MQSNAYTCILGSDLAERLPWENSWWLQQASHQFDHPLVARHLLIMYMRFYFDHSERCPSLQPEVWQASSHIISDQYHGDVHLIL